jgi:3-carboxy-cis,cis-muconate cycloisomerase
MQAALTDTARLQRMLDFEAALARAEAEAGVIPSAAAEPIAAACKADRFDPAAIGRDAVAAGNTAIPLVKALTKSVAEADAEAARYVHWGATSQDVIDTALALDLKAAIGLLGDDLDRAITGFAVMADAHRNTATVARTWLQQALPMPFGLKLAGYAAALGRSRARLMRLRDEALCVQFGGAAGTLAALDDKGLVVSQHLARLLGLPLPDAPWHSHRDRLGEIAAALSILAGTCGKIARDVSLLMQTEVGEASEKAEEGRGGSSTMPHKRNPVASAAAMASAALAPQLAATILSAEIHEHERSLSGWQVEWPTFPALLLCVSGALRNVVDLAEGLEVDAARMQRNLDITHGLIMAEAVSMALAKTIGKQAAHKAIEDISRKAGAEKKHLRDLLAEDVRITKHLTRDDIAKLCDPLSYQGVSQAFIDRLLAPLHDKKNKNS